MDPYKHTKDTGHKSGIISQNSEIMKTDTSKEKWLQKYASRILAYWSQWQTPLGVTCDYTDKIKNDLSRFYDDPLKKLFIEATY